MECYVLSWMLFEQIEFDGRERLWVCLGLNMKLNLKLKIRFSLQLLSVTSLRTAHPHALLTAFPHSTFIRFAFNHHIRGLKYLRDVFFFHCLLSKVLRCGRRNGKMWKICSYWNGKSSARKVHRWINYAIKKENFESIPTLYSVYLFYILAALFSALI